MENLGKSLILTGLIVIVAMVITFIAMFFGSTANANDVPMINYRGEKFTEVNCSPGKTCTKGITGEGSQNVTVVVNCTSCTDKKEKVVQKKKPTAPCKPKVIERVVEKVVTKRVEVEKPVFIEKEVSYPKNNILSLVVLYGQGGVINYLQTGQTPHEQDYILEKGDGVMIGPMYQHSFGNLTAGGMILSSGHFGGTIGLRW